MLACCWSSKGGSGTTVVAAALAVVLSKESPAGALVVDLAERLHLFLGLGDLFLEVGHSTRQDGRCIAIGAIEFEQAPSWPPNGASRRSRVRDC